MGIKGVITLLLSDEIVLPQIAKDESEKQEKLHKMNEIDIQMVLPLLTAPSQMMAS
jgi:hypothetical protein